ncbi:hypothetical protein BACIT_3156 [Bacillus amyloliquefaciens]|nr:hypothetical protein BACIT_3156 [Bacillus amyloliquefaciens]
MEETKQVGRGVLYGLVAIFAVMLLTSLAISLLLTVTSMEESSFSWLITALSFLSLFAGGFISGGKAKEKGWMIGALTAVCFFINHLAVSIFRVRKNVYIRSAFVSSRLFGSQYAGRHFRSEFERKQISVIKKERILRSFFVCMSFAVIQRKLL